MANSNGRHLRPCGTMLVYLALLLSLTCACPLDGARTARLGQGPDERELWQIVDEEESYYHGLSTPHEQARSLRGMDRPKSTQGSLQQRQQHQHYRHHHHHHHHNHGADHNHGAEHLPMGLQLCGTKHPSRRDRIRMGLVHAKYDRDNPDDEDEHGHYNFRALASSGTKQSSTLVNYVIPVRFNIFIANQTYGRMNLTHIQTGLMANVLKAYNGTGFRFQIKSVLNFVNATWAACKDQDTFVPKTHVGGAETLNVWICDLASTGYGGQSYYPPIIVSDPKYDGIMLMNPALGGADFAAQAFAHELGHWFGLAHTFEGGCSQKPLYNFDSYPDYYFIGDGVADTPAHANWTWFYPQKSYCWRNDSLDTCTADSGLDPVDNYMNYIPGNCFRDYGRFTPGQRKRMRAQWFRWRDPKTRRSS